MSEVKAFIEDSDDDEYDDYYDDDEYDDYYEDDDLPVPEETREESLSELSSTAESEEAFIEDSDDDDDDDDLPEETQEESLSELSSTAELQELPLVFSIQCSGFVSPRNKSCQPQLRPKKKEFVMIKVRTTQGSSRGEEDEKIRKEEAVCRSCSNIFQEADNMLKTKCECKYTLVHEPCANEWTSSQMNGNIKCNVCEQDIQMTPVTLCKHMDTNEGGTRKRWWNFKNRTTTGEGALKMC